MTEKVRTGLVGTDEAGWTVFEYLRKKTGLTKAQIRSLKFLDGGIRVNGDRARTTRVLKSGDVVALRFPVRPAVSGGDRSSSVCVLYEDEDMLVADKPQGMVVHPSHGHREDTLLFLAEQKLSAAGEPLRLHAIGRLDADTAGLVVLAKHPFAAGALWRQKEKGLLEKEYLAWCEGCPKETDRPMPSGEQLREQLHLDFHETGRKIRRIDAPIEKDPRYLNKMKCLDVRDGQEAGGSDADSGSNRDADFRTGEPMTAGTLLQCLQYLPGPDASLLRIRLETGRTHQIRVHLASEDHPLLGDSLYGNGTGGSTHAMLCAYRLTFRNLRTGEPVTVYSGHTQAFAMHGQAEKSPDGKNQFFL